jgi:hypothetical protein
MGMFQGGRSRNFRTAQGLQFVATQRRVSPKSGASPAGETGVTSEFAVNASGHLEKAAFEESGTR